MNSRNREYQGRLANAVSRIGVTRLLASALLFALAGCGPGASAPPAEFRIPVEVSTVETGDVGES